MSCDQSNKHASHCQNKLNLWKSLIQCMQCLQTDMCMYIGGGVSVLSAYIYKEMVVFFYYTVSRKRTDQMHANYTLYVMKLA